MPTTQVEPAQLAQWDTDCTNIGIRTLLLPLNIPIWKRHAEILQRDKIFVQQAGRGSGLPQHQELAGSYLLGLSSHYTDAREACAGAPHTKIYCLLLETGLTQTPSMSDRSRQGAEMTTKQRLKRTAPMCHDSFLSTAAQGCAVGCWGFGEGLG